MNEMTLDQERRFNLACLSLEGLATGDAFGQRFFTPGNIGLIAHREPPPPYWSYTDDTAMAVSIVRTLHVHGYIEQDDLAGRFGAAFDGDPLRGYGPGARRLLTELASGARWQDAAYDMFGGEGSYGNGGAMRASPIGAYFFDDLNRAVEQARLSAEVTHAHPEGQAGAIAIAVAAALCVEIALQCTQPKPKQLFSTVIDYVPDGLLRTNLKQAAVLSSSTSVKDAVRTLGNGSRIIAFDTVPFALWCAFHNYQSYTDALWTSVSAGGDVDTTSAIVGGIVVLSAGRTSIPAQWTASRESYPLVTGDQS